MEKPLSPQESLDIISQVIDLSKQKYEENGQLILMWGLAVMLAGITQFILIQLGHGKMSGWTWLFTMIPMSIYTIYMVQQERKINAQSNKKNSDISGMVWSMAGSMAMISGFFFSSKFGYALTAAMFLPFCIAALVTALTLNKELFVWLSILGVIISYCSFYIPWSYHPLLSAGLALVLFTIPGYILRNDHKTRSTNV